MLPYVLVFSISICLTIIGQKICKKKNNISIVLFGLAIVILSLFAALRDYSVGADLQAYKAIYYDRALNSSTFVSYLGHFNNEYLFSIFVYFIAHVFGSYRIVLFLLSFVPLMVMFHYGRKYYPKHMALILAVYLLMFFNTSLNVMRQVAAISCIIPAFYCIQDNKKIMALMLIIIASLFHVSALFMIILFLIYWCAKRKKQVKYYILLCIAFMITCTALGVLAKQDFIANMGYSGYVARGDTNMSIHLFALKVCIFIFISYYYKYYKKDDKGRNYYYFIILDLLFYLFSNYVMYGYRLSYYFVVFTPFILALIAEKIPNNSKTKAIFYIGVLISLTLYWVDRNMIVGYDSTIPYELGIFN